MEVAQRLLPVAVIDEVVPVGDLVVYRTAVVTVGDAAIHAARRLVAACLLGERDDEFAIVADAVTDRRVAPVVAIDLEEAGYLAHRRYSPAAA